MTITYIHGEDNTVADTLSRLPPNLFPDKIISPTAESGVNAILQIVSDASILRKYLQTGCCYYYEGLASKEQPLVYR